MTTYRGYTLYPFNGIIMILIDGESLSTATTVDKAKAIVDEWMDAP